MTMPAVTRPEDLRLQMSHLASTFASPLSQANLNAGKSWRPKSGIMPEPVSRFARQGPLAFTGHEYPIGANEREIARDLSFGLSFDLNSYLIGWAAAFWAGACSSAQEGSTGRYTHTIRPDNLLSSANAMQAKLTDMYFDSGSADANRKKAIALALALQSFSVSCRVGDNAQISMNFVGSGKEDASTAITLVALTSEVMLGGEQWKFERGDKGGALTDITEKIREWSFEFSQELALERGYMPNAATPSDGKFRSQFRVLRRMCAFSFVEEVDRANWIAAGGYRARAAARTQTETKVTVDSGVLAGVASASNHKMVIRVPDHRLPQIEPSYDPGGAVFNASVPFELINKDTGVTDTPVTITVDNEQASYLV